jgi:hypothetical protein
MREHANFMRIIAWSVLSSYADRHPDTKVPLLRWEALVGRKMGLDGGCAICRAERENLER